MKTLPALFIKIDLPLRRTLLLTALFGLVISLSVHASLVVDPDLWWHLRTGQWVFGHGTVTTTDPFSSYGQGKPWIAYSWLFEIIVYSLYQAWGLIGPLIYTVVLALGITLAWLSFIHKLTRKAALTVGLTALGLLACAPLLTPRPWLFTILFFILELDLLLTARRSGKLRPLVWLPIIFALWANIHIQFIYGFIPLGLWLIEPWLDQFRQRPFSFKRFQLHFDLRHWLIVAACLGATLATPYHVRLYVPIIEHIQLTGAYQYVTELQALSFRDPSHWIVLALMLGAAFSWGGQRTMQPFPAVLFLLGALLAFRSSRDVWVGVIASVTVIASSRLTAEEGPGDGLAPRGFRPQRIP